MGQVGEGEQGEAAGAPPRAGLVDRKGEDPEQPENTEPAGRWGPQAEDERRSPVQEMGVLAAVPHPVEDQLEDVEEQEVQPGHPIGCAWLCGQCWGMSGLG